MTADASMRDMPVTMTGRSFLICCSRALGPCGVCASANIATPPVAPHDSLDRNPPMIWGIAGGLPGFPSPRPPAPSHRCAPMRLSRESREWAPCPLVIRSFDQLRDIIPRDKVRWSFLRRSHRPPAASPNRQAHLQTRPHISMFEIACVSVTST